MGILQQLWDWCESVWDQIASLSLKTLILAATLQIGMTTFNALGWRGILGYTFPGKGRVKTKEIVAAYAGGIGLNNILPAQAGTITYLGLFKASIADSTIGGILGSAIVQNVFYAFMQVVIYVTVVFGGLGNISTQRTAQATDAHPVIDWCTAHKLLAAIIIGGGIALIVFACVLLWRKVKHFFLDAGHAATMLLHPTQYVPRTLLPQVIAYGCRIGVIVTFMSAFNIPVSFTTVALVIAATSLASTFAVTPGGVGTTQAAVALVLAPSGVTTAQATAYSLSQQLVTTAINIVFGLVMMASVYGWGATKGMIKRGKQGETGSMSDLQAQAEAERAGATAGAAVAAPGTPADAADAPGEDQAGPAP